MIQGETGSQAVGVQSLKSVFQIELWEPALSTEAGSSGPQLSSPGEWKRHTAMARGAGGQYVAVFDQSPTNLSHTTLSIKLEAYFSKERCPLVVIVLNMFLHAYVYIYSGCDYTTLISFLANKYPTLFQLNGSRRQWLRVICTEKAIVPLV